MMSIDTRFVVEDLVSVGRQLLRDGDIQKADSVLQAIQAVLGPFVGGANYSEAEYTFRCATVWALDDEITAASRAASAKWGATSA